MTCQRCGVEGELGECPFCHRYLCLACYDLDQDYPCRLAPLEQRDDAIRALRGGLTVKEIAKSFATSQETVYRVTR